MRYPISFRLSVTRTAAFFVASVPLTLCVPQAFAQSAYPQAVLANNPVAYFRLGSANEGSLVNGFTTTFNNAATTTAPGGGAPLTSEPGNIGAALSGTPGTFVSTSLSGQAQFATGGNATILAWVNLSQLPSVANRFFYVAGRSQSGNDLDVQFQNDNRLYFYTDSGSALVYTPDAATLLNNYHFIAATLDTTASIRSIYFDGNLVATQTNIPGRGLSSAQFTIGESAVFMGRQFQGAIDEVALFNTTLTSQQVQTIYNARLSPAAGTGAPEPGTLALLGAGLVPLGGILRRRVRSAKAA